MSVRITSFRVGGRSIAVPGDDNPLKKWLVGKVLSFRGWRHVQKAVGEAITTEATKRIKDDKNLREYLTGVRISVKESADTLILSVRGFDAMKEEVGWSPVPPDLESGLGVEPMGKMDMRPLLLARGAQSGKRGGTYRRVPIEVDGGYEQVFGEMEHGLNELAGAGELTKRTAQKRLKEGRELIEQHKRARYRAIENRPGEKAYTWPASKTLNKKGEELFAVGENAATKHPYSTWIYSRLTKRMFRDDNGKWKSSLNTIRTVTSKRNGRWWTKGVKAKDIFLSDAVQTAVVRAVQEALLM